jgi:hypothetical protein
LCVWKNCLVENNVPRDVDFSSGQVEASVALLFTRVAKEDAASGARGKVVASGGNNVGKT